MNTILNRVTILGSGTSTGVPIIGCNCAVCSSTLPKNKRLRSSLYLQTAAGTSLVVDTSPDLRAQLLLENVNHLDGVIITHDHADHLHGLDDLRPLTFNPAHKKIPLYTSEATRKSIEQRFPYIFPRGPQTHFGGGIPALEINVVKLNESFPINKDFFSFFSLPHGATHVLGFIHQKFAYLIDCHEIPAPIISILRSAKLDLLIIDCASRLPHRTHLSIDKTLHYIQLIGAKRAGLTHLSHDFEHYELSEELSRNWGEHIFPVFDGMKLDYEILL